jgi:hypothetical protein
VPLRRDLFVTGPGPDAGGSKLGAELWAHKPEKSGVTIVPWLGFCANTADETKVTAAVVAMIKFLMIDFFR